MTNQLKKLQRAYLVAELESMESLDAQSCHTCWKKGCSCNVEDSMIDPFLNTPNNNEVLVFEQLQYA